MQWCGVVCPCAALLPKVIQHEMIYRIEQGLGTGAMPALPIQEGGGPKNRDASSIA